MKLNLGCGPDIAGGWVNADRLNIPGAIYADPATGLPWPTGTFDGAVAHHVLQMVASHDIVGWLAEVRRVLRPGGWLRISVPDLVAAFAAYSNRDAGWFPISYEDSLDGKLCLYLAQSGTTRSVFTSSWLCALCDRAGFTDTVLGINEGPGWLSELDSRPDESIYATARS